MYTDFKSHLITELQGIKDAGLYKNERIITTAPVSYTHLTLPTTPGV